MSDVTKVACWPACVDATDWSHDGIIALASEEQVELLFPQTKSNDTEHDFSSWHHIPLPVSWFTADELSEKEAAPVSSYSIGEEVSTSAPVSIAWSPPGIAKHRRCALGVLTSSLVLSIWASEGKVDDGASWKRKLIINNALVEYFSGNIDEVESNLAQETVEKMRLRTRIRCFAWAPPLSSLHPGAIMGTQTKWDQPIVAVANGDNQVTFVAIDSPTTTLGTEEEWSGEVLNHFSIMPDSESIFAKPETFDEIMHQQRHISQIAWSPWSVQGDWYHSVLVYATNEDVRARVVTYSGETIGIGNDEVVYSDIGLRYTGPMKWSSKVEDGDTVTLTLFTAANVIVLKISASNATIVARAQHDLGGRWDEMSAAAWDYTADEPSLHFASLQATLNYTTQFKYSDNSLIPIPAHPHWRDQLWDAQTLFSAQHELKGSVRTKLWGLSASPLGDFIATCSTVHPSDMIEYGPPNERRTSIAISALRSSDQQANLEVSAQNFSAEGLVFTLQKWAEGAEDGNESFSSSVDDVAARLFDMRWRPKPTERVDASTLPDSADKLQRLIRHVKEDAMLNEHTTKDRFTVLVSQTCSPSASTDLPRTLISYRVAAAVQKLPYALSQTTPFSAKIHEHHRRVVLLINAIMADETALQQATPTEPCDTCNFCQADIPLTDLTSATCTNGHHFPRCGLSFLAIQAPWITKYCGLCRTPYLSEEFLRIQEVATRELNGRASVEPQPEGLLPSVEAGDTSDTINEGAHHSQADTAEEEREGGRLPVSLARVLFLACDVCIYCGGKFTG